MPSYYSLVQVMKIIDENEYGKCFSFLYTKIENCDRAKEIEVRQ